MNSRGEGYGGTLSWGEWLSSRRCVRGASPNYIGGMCGRVIQSSRPFNLAIVHGMNVHESRVSNYPPRYNAAPSQELLVIRRNRDTREVSLDPLRWGLIPYWCKDPKGGRKPIKRECGNGSEPADVSRSVCRL